MHGDEAHAVNVDSVTDTLDECIVNRSVCDMSPPHEDIRRIKDLIGKALLGLIERCNPDVYLFIASEKLGYSCMKAVRIDFFDVFVIFFVNEFTPYGYVNFFCHISAFLG